MTLDYFYGQAGELFSFYRIPKALFQEPRFQSLSTNAKTLYGILLDRMSLSAKNGWLDEQGRVFIIFTIEDVKRALCCADNKATKLLRELEEFGLIERKRRGLGKPSLVYVKNFSAESSKSIFQNRDFHDSGGFKSASQDPAKPRCNKTEENNTEMSETYDAAMQKKSPYWEGTYKACNIPFTDFQIRYQPEQVRIVDGKRILEDTAFLCRKDNDHFLILPSIYEKLDLDDWLLAHLFFYDKDGKRYIGVELSEVE